jgi:hypothetical protein
MRAWQTPEIVRYFDYQRHSPDDTPVPDRPSTDYEWVDGTGWVIPADLEDRLVAQILERTNYDPWDRLLFELLWDMENRMRVQEGLQSVSRLIYRNALLNRLKALRAQVSGPKIADSEGDGNGTEADDNDQHRKR